MENSKIKIVFTKDVKETKVEYTKEVELKVPTGKMKKVFLEYLSKISSVERKDKINRVVAKYAQLEDINGDRPNFEAEITEKALKSGELTLYDVMEFNDKASILEEDEVFYSLMKEIVSTANLTTDEKAQIEDPEFWLNQDYQGVVVKSVNQFRAEFNLLHF